MAENQIVKQGADEPWHRFVQRASRVFRRAAASCHEPQQRLLLLQAFAAVKVSGWNQRTKASFWRRYLRVRARPATGPVAPCFVCGVPSTTRHHVIQIQHGGGNHKRNKVPICGHHHAEVHPWLKQPAA